MLFHLTFLTPSYLHRPVNVCYLYITPQCNMYVAIFKMLMRFWWKEEKRKSCVVAKHLPNNGHWSAHTRGISSSSEGGANPLTSRVDVEARTVTETYTGSLSGRKKKTQNGGKKMKWQKHEHEEKGNIIKWIPSVQSEPWSPSLNPKLLSVPASRAARRRCSVHGIPSTLYSFFRFSNRKHGEPEPGLVSWRESGFQGSELEVIRATVIVSDLYWEWIVAFGN